MPELFLIFVSFYLIFIFVQHIDLDISISVLKYQLIPYIYTFYRCTI